MSVNTASFRKGDVVSAHLKHALEAPNGRIIPISASELNSWFRSFYRLVENKHKETIAVVTDRADHGMWVGTVVDKIHLQRGDWRIIRSDDSVTKITQQHTRPLGALNFMITGGGVLATYAAPIEKNTPAADQIAKPGSYEGSTE